MNNKNPDIQFVGKIHEVLLDNFVLAGIRASSVAQGNKRSGIRVLISQMIIPHPLDIVTNESGSVVADPHRHISHLFGDIIDAVRNNHSISECGEIMVESLKAAIRQSFAIPFEVPQHLFLLRVNADDGKSCHVRFDDSHNSLLPFRMLWKNALVTGTRSADAPIFRTFIMEKFLNAIFDCMRACFHFFANLAVAEPFGFEVCGFGCQEPSSVPFVQSGHIRQITWREDFWRSFLSHLK